MKLIAICASSLLLLLTISSAVKAEDERWFCNDEHFCLQTDSLSAADSQLFESQNDCRLSCGPYGAIWPLPTVSCQLAHERVRFDPQHLRFNVVAPNKHTSHFLREARHIFMSNILLECSGNCTPINRQEVFVKIAVNSSSLELDLQTDESYELHIHTMGKATFVGINATSVYGARMGLETLSNLITNSQDDGLLLVSHATIMDRPIFAHRGVLLDTSRHFMPLSAILRTLDAMAASKLNVFHWHVVDSHSFPLEIKRVPEMQRFGAYSPAETYSAADAAHVISYAKRRGIRVVIEIDAPSHAGNGWQWGPSAGLGNLSLCINQAPWQSYCGQPPCGQLNPLNNNTYDVLERIYEDIAEMIMPGELFHMGGDEVSIACWKSADEITEYLLEHAQPLKTNSYMKLWADFHARSLQKWDEVRQRQNLQPQSVVVWSSDLTAPATIKQYLPADRFIVQTWVDAKSTLNDDLIALGYRVIVSTSSAWYFDHGFLGSTSYYNWKKVYNNPLRRHAQMLGGEVCMWSEYVDQNGLEPRVWPRAGAAAERLWSDPSTAAEAAEPRFNRYRERLIARGIHPDAVTPQWCVLHESECY